MWDARRNRQLGEDKPYLAVIDVRDLKIHSQLRKRWNEAFSAAPLKDYQDILVSRVGELGDHFEEQCQRAPGGVVTLDIYRWFSFFA